MARKRKDIPPGFERGIEDGAALVELQARQGGQELPRDREDAAVDAITGILQWAWSEGLDTDDILRIAQGHFDYEMEMPEEEVWRG